MGKAAADRIEQQVRAFFPADAFARVQVLQYGDDPEVEPGETAIRVFISRTGRPEGKEADAEIVEAFKEANHAVLKKARDGLPPFIGWVEFRADGPGGTAGPRGPVRSGSAAAGGGRGHSMKYPRN